MWGGLLRRKYVQRLGPDARTQGRPRTTGTRKRAETHGASLGMGVRRRGTGSEVPALARTSHEPPLVGPVPRLVPPASLTSGRTGLFRVACYLHGVFDRDSQGTEWALPTLTLPPDSWAAPQVCGTEASLRTTHDPSPRYPGPATGSSRSSMCRWNLCSRGQAVL